LDILLRKLLNPQLKQLVQENWEQVQYLRRYHENIYNIFLIFGFWVLIFQDREFGYHSKLNNKYIRELIVLAR